MGSFIDIKISMHLDFLLYTVWSMDPALIPLEATLLSHQ